jgi:hypothetical protein
MSAILELIELVESLGGRFMVDGDRLGIVPATAAAPVVEQLREHKAQIIDLLKSRTSADPAAEHSPTMPPMPQGAKLIRWKPRTAPVRLSPCSTVTDTEKFIHTTLAQLGAHLKGAKFVDGGWGLSGLLDRLEACGCVVTLDDPRRALQ